MKKLIFTVLLSSFLMASESQIAHQSILEGLLTDIVYIITDKKAERNSTTKSSIKVESTKTIEIKNTPPERVQAVKSSNSLTNIDSSEKEEKRLLKKMGIEIEDGKISIDANRTKSFLESFGKTLEKSIKKGIESASKELPKEADLGVKVEGEKIEIDLNKSKRFMERWMGVIETFAKELDKSIEPLTK